MAAAVLLVPGCQPAPTATPPVAATTATVTPPPIIPVTPVTTATPAASQTPLKDALTQLFAAAGETGSPFPAGTHLLSVKLNDGVAGVDVSKEFNGILQRGESSESEAQKALRRTLAPIPKVDKMTLTVEGKPFDSQATDWTTPFSVHEVGDFGSAGSRHRGDTNPNGGGQ